jgi:hypothetical protein
LAKTQAGRAPLAALLCLFRDCLFEGHLANIYGKLHVATRTEAVMRAVSLGWLSPAEAAE